MPADALVHTVKQSQGSARTEPGRPHSVGECYFPAGSLAQGGGHTKVQILTLVAAWPLGCYIVPQPQFLYVLNKGDNGIDLRGLNRGLREGRTHCSLNISYYHCVLGKRINDGGAGQWVVETLYSLW